MHPIVTVQSAHAGRLESPAVLRKHLVPKVAIGTKYVAPKFDHWLSSGEFRGYGRSLDADASAIQNLIIGRGSFRKRATDTAWWAVGIALMAGVVLLTLSQA